MRVRPRLTYGRSHGLIVSLIGASDRVSDPPVAGVIRQLHEVTVLVAGRIDP